MTPMRRWLEVHAWEEVHCAGGDTSEGLRLWVTHTRAGASLTDYSQGQPTRAQGNP